jgi:hypothetical protein
MPGGSPTLSFTSVTSISSREMARPVTGRYQTISIYMQHYKVYYEVKHIITY